MILVVFWAHEACPWAQTSSPGRDSACLLGKRREGRLFDTQEVAGCKQSRRDLYSRARPWSRPRRVEHATAAITPLSCSAQAR